MRKFNSSNFTFRPTSLGQRLAEAGLVESAHLVREPKIEVISGNKHRHIAPGIGHNSEQVLVLRTVAR